MQIHELTQPKKLDEAVYSGPAVKAQPGAAPSPIATAAKAAGSAVAKQFNKPTLGSKLVGAAQGAGAALASPFKELGGAYKDARQASKINAMADKAYKAWKTYETQLLKSDPNAKQDGTYEKQLLAFVNKNLLGGMYLPNVINKDKIIGLVKKISSTPAPTGGAGAGGTPTATPTGTVHTANPNNPNLPKSAPIQGGSELQKAQAAGSPARQAVGDTRSELQIAAEPGSIAQQQLAKTSPAKKRPTYSVKGATKAGAPTPAEQAVLQQKIAAAAAKKPMNEAVDPTQELFKQLVQQAALAQTQAPGTAQTTQSAANQPTAGAGNQPQSARSIDLAQYIDPAIVKNLPVIGAKLTQASGNPQVQSTGNPFADAALISMGFQGL